MRVKDAHFYMGVPLGDERKEYVSNTMAKYRDAIFTMTVIDGVQGVLVDMPTRDDAIFIPVPNVRYVTIPKGLLKQDESRTRSKKAEA